MYNHLKLFPRIIYSGDKEKARKYRHAAIAEFNLLKHLASFQSLQQSNRVKVFTDGTIIKTKKTFNDGVIAIYSPPSEVEEREGGERVFTKGPYVVIKITGEIGRPVVPGETHDTILVTVFDIPTNAVAEDIPRNDELGGGFCRFPCDWNEITDWWLRSPEMQDKLDVSPLDSIKLTPCPSPPRTLNQNYTCYNVDGVEETHMNTFVEDSDIPSPLPECSDYDWSNTLDYNEYVMTPPSTTPISPPESLVWFQSYKVMYNQTPESDPGAALISSAAKSQHAYGENEEDVTQICVWDSDDPPNLIGRTISKSGTDSEYNQTIYTTPLGVASHRIEGNMSGGSFQNTFVPSENHENAEWNNNIPYGGDTSGQFPTGLANWGVGDIQILRDKLTQDEIDWLITNYPIAEEPYYQMPTNMLNYTTDSDYMLQFYISRFSYANYVGECDNSGCYYDIVFTNDIPSSSFQGYPNDYVDIFAAVGKISSFETFDFRGQQRNNELETAILNTIGEMKTQLRPHLVWDNAFNYIAFRPNLYLVGIDENKIQV